MKSKQLVEALRAAVAASTGMSIDDVGENDQLVDLGVDSASAIEIAVELSEKFNCYVDPTLFFSRPTLAKIADVVANVPATIAVQSLSTTAPQPRNNAERIAVIGIGCRFPGAYGPEDYWRLLNTRQDAIAAPVSSSGGRSSRHSAGLLPEPFKFDAEAFGLRPAEAEVMDPQQRWLLETAWEAIDDAGLRQSDLAGRKVGVFIGLSGSDYRAVSQGAGMPVAAVTGNAGSIAANRLSYFFDLRGPSVAVDTACSSSLAALNLAVRSLRSGECDLALVGGVNALLDDDLTDALAAGGMLADDGRCKTFDAEANGYVRGEGCGLLVLRRETDAKRAGDRIYAAIAGVAWNQDGRTNGLTAPSPTAQVAVIRGALADGGIDPANVGYIEAHGTGTILGDPIEVRAISEALGGPQRSKIHIGSAKTHVGHLEAAAGVAGVIKACLSIYHGSLPPSLNFETPNPHIPFEQLNVAVQDQPSPWPSDERVAGVSSFGFGGTNTHAVLVSAASEHVELIDEPASATPRLVPLSGQSKTALAELAGRWADWIEQHPEATFEQVVSTATHRRSMLRYRRGLIATSLSELKSELRRVATERTQDLGAPPDGQRTLFVFSGQGSQYPAMGLEWEQLPAAGRAVVRRCDALSRSELGWSVVDELVAPGSRSRLSATEIAQPCLFAWQAALAASWRAWGIVPDAIIGHSVGELAAAYFAGALSLDDAFRLAAVRGSAMADLAGTGAMLAVELSRQEVLDQIFPTYSEVCIAAQNGPQAIVLSGPLEALERVKDQVDALERLARWTSRDYPFHSAACAEAGAVVTQAACDTPHRSPILPWYSTVTGEQVVPEAFDNRYWRDNACCPVLFDAALSKAEELKLTHVVEFGGQPVLRSHLTRASASGSGFRAHSADGSDHTSRLKALGRWFEDGGNVNFDALISRRNVPVGGPLYPWADTRFVSQRRVRPGTQPKQDRLLAEIVSLPPAARMGVFSCFIDLQQHDWLRDHVIAGENLFPASGYLEVLLEAAEALGVAFPWTLRHVTFLKPLVMADRSTELTVVAERASDAVTLTVYHQSPRTGDEGWSTLCKAELVGGVTPDPPLAAVASVKSNIDISELYEKLDRRGYSYGPEFRGIERLQADSGGASADLRPARGRWLLDPRTLDCALQCAAAAGGIDDEGLYLPFRVERFVYSGQPTSDLNVIVELREHRPGVQTNANIALQSGGKVCARIDGIQFLRAASSSSEQHEALWIYESSWSEKPILSPRRVSPVLIGDGFEEGNVPPEVRLISASVDESLIARMRACEAEDGLDLVIVDMRWLHTQHDTVSDLGLAEICTTIAESIRLLAEAPISGRVSYMTCLGRGMAKALAGFIRTSNLECPTLHLKLVQVELDGSEVLPALLREAGAGDEETELRLAVDARLARRVTRAAVRSGGAFQAPNRADWALVVGGFGGLGRFVLQWLATRGLSRILVVGRSAPDPAFLDEMAGQVDLRWVMADVGSPDAAQRIAEARPGDWPPSPLGVLHLAGALDDGALFDMGADRFSTTLVPKLGGLRVAMAMAGSARWIVVFGSAASFLGSPGQANYAVANSAVASAADELRRAGWPVSCVEWGPWAAAGMAAEQGGESRLNSMGVSFIQPDAGFALLERIITGPPRNVSVMPFDLVDLVRYYPDAPGFLAFSDLLDHRSVALRSSGANTGIVARPNLSTPYEPPVTETETVIAAAWRRALAMDRIGVHDSFFELGGDSVMANQILVDLSKRFEIKIRAERAFEAFTIASISQMVDEVLAVGSPEIVAI